MKLHYKIIADGDFVEHHLHRFLDRFDVTFVRGYNKGTYLITRKDTGKSIGSDLILTLTKTRSVYIKRFMPELRQFHDTDKMSAACFYLIISHFVTMFHLDVGVRLQLDTKPSTFKAFYKGLLPFGFKQDNHDSSQLQAYTGHYCHTSALKFIDKVSSSPLF